VRKGVTIGDFRATRRQCPGRQAERHDRQHAPTLVAVAHGSPDPRAGQTIHALIRLIRALRPGIRVELGHLETDEPPAHRHPGQAARRSGAGAAAVSRGYHIKYDIPAAIAGAGHLTTLTAGCLGPHPLLAEALHSRLADAGYRRGTAVIPGRRGLGRPGVPGRHWYTAGCSPPGWAG